jgi:hypothetical protein
MFTFRCQENYTSGFKSAISDNRIRVLSKPFPGFQQDTLFELSFCQTSIHPLLFNRRIPQAIFNDITSTVQYCDKSKIRENYSSFQWKYGLSDLTISYVVWKLEYFSREDADMSKETQKFMAIKRKFRSNFPWFWIYQYCSFWLRLIPNAIVQINCFDLFSGRPTHSTIWFGGRSFSQLCI